jgi:hypothetical protein
MNPTTFSHSKDALGPLFQHDRLDLNKRTFRLLHILPNLESDIIQCDLTTADFTSEYEGAYNALSYEWGPEEPPFYWIRLKDGYLHIRQNLHNFLHMARRKAKVEPDFTDYLWIDAICINQQDLLERGHLVKQMSDIYSHAKVVLVWLGPCISNDMDAALDKLHELDETAQEIATSSVRDWKCLEALARPLLIPSNSKVSLAVSKIWNNTYWTRIWIIQEITSAKKAYQVLGDHVLS